MRGGNDAHIGTDAGVPAHAVKAAIGEHAQQARLRLQWHVADLIEKQRAALGLLKAPLAQGGGAGEGAALVAKQFRFDQVARNGGHVQRNKGPVAAWAVAVQRLGHQLFAGARCAVDEHRDVRLRQAANGAKHLLHGRCLANQPGGLAKLGGGGRRFALARVRQGALHQGDGFIDIEGLGQVLKGSALVGLDGAVQVGVRRHDDDRHLRAVRAHMGQQLQAIHARHADIGEDDAGLAGGAHLRQLFEHGIGAVEQAGGDACLGQCLVQNPADGGVVVDDPDLVTGGGGGAGGGHGGRCPWHGDPSVGRAPGF